MRSVLLCFFLLTLRILAIAQQVCGTAAYQEFFARQEPQSQARLASVQAFTRKWIESRKSGIAQPAPAAESPLVIRIPVVVHIIYFSGAQNISDEQVRSQLAVLNQDYRRRNADAANTPAIFQPFAADCSIEFVLATEDPNGHPTNGILRRQTNLMSFSIDDRVKSSAAGGDDPWNPDNYLNIWVTNLTNGILGYASLPGSPRNRDGVTIHYTAFGTMGTAQTPFNRGRTATHEIGHWLNLIHVWGDTDCGTDEVDDTPPQRGPNRGCPGTLRTTCGSGPYGDMYMNFMDFTDDACMNMFTQGQSERMRSLFAPGGSRSALLNSTAANAKSSSSRIDFGQTADNAANLIRLFPNPASDRVTIRIEDTLDLPQTLGVYNAMGQKLMTITLYSNQQEIHVGSLGKGIYILRTENGKQQIVAKLLKL